MSVHADFLMPKKNGGHHEWNNNGAVGGKTAKAVTGSVKEWTGFLQSAARLYKYSYPEQLLIYAQRPDATACASYEIWN